MLLIIYVGHFRGRERERERARETERESLDKCLSVLPFVDM